MRRLSLLVLLTATTAAADTALPYELVFGGKRVDLAAGKVLGDSGPPARCDYRDGAYWRDREHPDVIRWGKSLEARITSDPAPETPTFAQKGRRHILYQYWYGGHAQVATTVVDARDGRRVFQGQQPPSLLVEDAAGQLLGLLTLDTQRHELRLVDGRTGATRWRVARPDLWGDSGQALVLGDRLLVTAFNRIASGSRLFAVELATGKLVWEGDVQQLGVSHSKYFNDVTLSLQGPSVVLHGREAGGCYLQVFDATSGARRLALTDRRW